MPVSINWARTRRLAPAMRTLPVSTVPTCNCSRMARMSCCRSRNCAAVFHATTRMPGTLVSAWISSSVRPSLKYSFSGLPPRSAKGSTATVITPASWPHGRSRAAAAQRQARRVAAGDELDEHRVGAAVAFVIGLQLGAQTARFHADDRVHARIVGRFAVEDFDADQVFLQFVGLAGQRAFHCQAQKSDHALGAGEKLVRQNLFQLLPDCGVRTLQVSSTAARCIKHYRRFMACAAIRFLL